MIEGCELMSDVVIQIGDMFATNRIDKHLLQDTKTMQCLLENQTVRFPEVLTDRTCRELKVWFPRNCEEKETVACCSTEGEGCDIEFEDTMPVECNTYGPNFCEETFFGACDDQCDTNISYQERLANSMMTAEAALLKKLNVAIVTEMATKVKPFELDEDCSDFEVDMETGAITIPAAYWNGDIVWDLQDLAKEVNLNDYQIFSGRLLQKELWKASKGGAACCDKEEDKYSDLPDICFSSNQDKILKDKCMFFVEKGAMGVFTTHQYQNQSPQKYGGDGGYWGFSKQLGNLTFRSGNQTFPVMVDVEYQEKCKMVTLKSGLCEKRPAIAGKMRLRAGVVCQPDDCNGLNGILKFNCK